LDVEHRHTVDVCVLSVEDRRPRIDHDTRGVDYVYYSTIIRLTPQESSRTSWKAVNCTESMM